MCQDFDTLRQKNDGLCVKNTTLDLWLSMYFKKKMLMNHKRLFINGQIGGVHLTILSVILNKCKYFDKLYVFPTQLTLLKWVKDGSGLKRCRRTLNYALLRLEGQGFIKRIQRHYNDRILGHVFRSTLYELTNHGLRKLQWLGVPAFKIAKSLTRGVKGRPKKNSRLAGREDRKGNLGGIEGIIKHALKDFKPG